MVLMVWVLRAVLCVVRRAAVPHAARRARRDADGALPGEDGLPPGGGGVGWVGLRAWGWRAVTPRGARARRPPTAALLLHLMAAAAPALAPWIGGVALLQHPQWSHLKIPLVGVPADKMLRVARRAARGLLHVARRALAAGRCGRGRGGGGGGPAAGRWVGARGRTNGAKRVQTFASCKPRRRRSGRCVLGRNQRGASSAVAWLRPGAQRHARDGRAVDLPVMLQYRKSGSSSWPSAGSGCDALLGAPAAPGAAAPAHRRQARKAAVKIAMAAPCGRPHGAWAPGHREFHTDGSRRDRGRRPWRVGSRQGTMNVD